MLSLLTPTSIVLAGCGILTTGYTVLAIKAGPSGERIARVIQICLLSAIAVVFTLAMLPDTLPIYDVQAIDASGNLFIAGSGNSCSQAYIQAVYPDNVQSVKCVLTK
jgi:hypothetical protein